MATAVLPAPLAPESLPLHGPEIRVGRVQHLHDGWYVDGVGPMDKERAESELDWLDSMNGIPTCENPGRALGLRVSRQRTPEAVERCATGTQREHS